MRNAKCVGHVLILDRFRSIEQIQQQLETASESDEDWLDVSRSDESFGSSVFELDKVSESVPRTCRRRRRRREVLGNWTDESGISSRFLSVDFLLSGWRSFPWQICIIRQKTVHYKTHFVSSLVLSTHKCIWKNEGILTCRRLAIGSSNFSFVLPLCRLLVSTAAAASLSSLFLECSFYINVRTNGSSLFSSDQTVKFRTRINITMNSSSRSSVCYKCNQVGLSWWFFLVSRTLGLCFLARSFCPRMSGWWWWKR